MGWFNFSFNGSATVQTEDAETCTVKETGESGFTLPYDIHLSDLVLTKSLAQNHQFSIWVNGKKMSSNLYSAQLDPSNDTRFAIAPLGIVIKAGSRVQVKTAQLDEPSTAVAESGILTMVFNP